MCLQIWAFANLNVDPGSDLLDTIAAHSVGDLHNYSAQNVSNTLWAFAKLNYAQPSFLADALAHVLTHLADFSPQSVVSLTALHTVLPSVLICAE